MFTNMTSVEECHFRSKIVKNSLTSLMDGPYDFFLNLESGKYVPFGCAAYKMKEFVF